MLPLYTIIGSPPHFTGCILSWRRKCKENISLFVKPANFSVIHKKEALKGKRKIYCSGNYIPLSPLIDSRVDYWETILYGIAGKVIAFSVIVILEKLAESL